MGVGALAEEGAAPLHALHRERGRRLAPVQRKQLRRYDLLIVRDAERESQLLPRDLVPRAVGMDPTDPLNSPRSRGDGARGCHANHAEVTGRVAVALERVGGDLLGEQTDVREE
eukprot:gene5960-biopygen7903